MTSSANTGVMCAVQMLRSRDYGVMCANVMLVGKIYQVIYIYLNDEIKSPKLLALTFKVHVSHSVSMCILKYSIRNERWKWQISNNKIK